MRFLGIAGFCLLYYGLTGCGSDNRVPGTYNVTYTPISVIVEFPPESPVTGPACEEFIARVDSPCDMEHRSLDPTSNEIIEPSSFSDVLEFSFDGESIAATGDDGTRYVGMLLENKASLTAVVFIPRISEEICGYGDLCPEGHGNAELVVEFNQGGFVGTLEYALDIEAEEVRLADCSSVYEGKGKKR